MARFVLGDGLAGVWRTFLELLRSFAVMFAYLAAREPAVILSCRDNGFGVVRALSEGVVAVVRLVVMEGVTRPLAADGVLAVPKDAEGVLAEA